MLTEARLYGGDRGAVVERLPSLNPKKNNASSRLADNNLVRDTLPPVPSRDPTRDHSHRWEVKQLASFTT